ncbi:MULTISPECIES: type II toxin-antitoxin system ParD family antitoxin [unclassified Sphingomonas]|uniref:type II toxin-antitoxin system ParD family antitoxin n=1 Tax=unclassified Sphingomonas TaxID=196159 RepID=UPI0009E7A5AC|nr:MULTISPECIES: type II toxin-antitoxin system ParD family antitoxin [unclassified Sphingomonas]
MNISLPDPMRAFVQRRIDAGDYASASDYVRDLIRRDQAEDMDVAAWLQALDQSIEQGLADADAGRVRDLDAVCDDLIAKLEQGTGKEGE